MKNAKRIFALLLALLTVLTMAFTFAGCKKGDEGEDPDAESQTEEKEKEEEETKPVIYRFSPDNAPTNYIRINTKGYGTMIVELYPDVAPKTVAHFKNLVKDGFYNKLIFHRIVKDCVVQTGDPKGDGTGSADTTVEGEFSANGFENTLSHTRGVVSMARYDDDYDSASSQFFFCLKDLSEDYDGEYAAFGKVIEGIETLDKLAAVQVFGEYPLDPPEILSVRFVYPD